MYLNLSLFHQLQGLQCDRHGGVGLSNLYSIQAEINLNAAHMTVSGLVPVNPVTRDIVKPATAKKNLNYCWLFKLQA